MSNAHPSTLETARLILRSPRVGDGAALEAILSDWHVARMLAHVPHPYPPGGGEQFVASILSGARPFAHRYVLVLRDAPDSAVGMANVGPFAEAPAHWGLGYYLSRALWGRGLMREALAAILSETFESGRVEAVFADVYDDNPASARVLSALGFEVVEARLSPCDARGHAVASHRFRRSPPAEGVVSRPPGPPRTPGTAPASHR